MNSIPSNELWSLLAAVVTGFVVIGIPVSLVALIVGLLLRNQSKDEIGEVLKRWSRTTLTICGLAVLAMAGVLVAAGLVLIIQQVK